MTVPPPQILNITQRSGQDRSLRVMRNSSYMSLFLPIHLFLPCWRTMFAPTFHSQFSILNYKKYVALFFHNHEVLQQSLFSWTSSLYCFFYFRSSELAVIKVCIEAVFIKKFLMSAFFNNISIIHNQY